MHAPFFTADTFPCILQSNSAVLYCLKPQLTACSLHAVIIAADHESFARCDGLDPSRDETLASCQAAFIASSVIRPRAGLKHIDPITQLDSPLFEGVVLLEHGLSHTSREALRQEPRTKGNDERCSNFSRL